MGKLIYSNIASLDGYIEDERGNFDWGEPDDDVHTFVNDLVRPVGTYLYGRRLYEVMRVWQDVGPAGQPAYTRDFAEIWRAADKVVYSKTLDTPSTPRTRIEPDFDPDAVRKMKEATADDLAVGGPNLALHAFKAGLVDECHLFLVPMVVGGGKRALPNDVRFELDLVNERRFRNGVVYVGYRVRTSP